VTLERELSRRSVEIRRWRISQRCLRYRCRKLQGELGAARAISLTAEGGWRNQARERHGDTRIPPHPPFHIAGAYPSAGRRRRGAAGGGRHRQTRGEYRTQAACLDHRQPSDPSRRPKPSFLLLMAFRLLSLLPPFPVRFLPPSALLSPLPSPVPTPNPLPLSPTPPSPRLPLLRLSVSSSRGELRYSRKARFRTRRRCVHSPLRFFLHFCGLSRPPAAHRGPFPPLPSRPFLRPPCVVHLSSSATVAAAATSRSRRSSFRNAAAAGGREIFANPSLRRPPSHPPRRALPPSLPALPVPSFSARNSSSSFLASKRS